MISEEKNKSLYSYLFEFSKILEEEYGKKKWYTKQEVDVVAEKKRLLNEFIVYGHSIYLEEKEFSVIYDENRNESDYQVLRQELRGYAKKYTDNLSSRPKDYMDGADWSMTIALDPD